LALYIVSTPIGNLDDVTLRALGVLADVERVYAEDTRRTRILFDRHDLHTPLRSLHAHNEASRVDEVLRLLEDGADVALVSDAGTPLVSDPGDRLVRRVLDAGHEVVPVPGASAVLASLVASGLAAGSFTFAGFLPRKKSGRRKGIERIANSEHAVVLFEAPARLIALLSDLAEVVGPERPVAVARELTKLHEEVFRGTVEEALDHFTGTKPKGEITLVLGAAPEATEDEEGARALATARLAEGARATDVVRDVMERFGLGRNAAYRLVQDVRE
jgi:16S rRNA (cytidine1402-2'-O)-methyltransferase